MVAEVFSAMIQGIEGQIVKIQVDISNGLPNFNMIGYLSNEVKESKERVRTALNNIGVLLPEGITFNLSGRLQSRDYTKKTGDKEVVRTTYEVVVHKINNIVWND